MNALQLITTTEQNELLSIANETLKAPKEFQKRLDSWVAEYEARAAKREADATELEALTKDHRRLNAVSVELSREVSAEIAGLQDEAARNPAADLAALAQTAERARQKAAFVAGTVNALVTRLIPRQSVQVKKSVTKEAQAKTQVALHELVTVFAEFLTLAAPLAAAQGISGIETTPKVQLHLDRAVEAWRQERAASEEFVKANTALAETERALAQISL